mmetsp:Transcript_31089/g.46917  ORF Transcript_31089/g.46917 Transcript_31089/m.46917 type:complete len:200 (+) Transcript_31089:463-1062(+)
MTPMRKMTILPPTTRPTVLVATPRRRTTPTRPTEARRPTTPTRPTTRTRPTTLTPTPTRRRTKEAASKSGFGSSSLWACWRSPPSSRSSFSLVRAPSALPSKATTSSCSEMCKHSESDRNTGKRNRFQRSRLPAHNAVQTPMNRRSWPICPARVFAIFHLELTKLLVSSPQFLVNRRSWRQLLASAACCLILGAPDYSI